MTQPLSHTAEVAKAYIRGNNETVAMVEEVLSVLNQESQTRDTMRIEEVQELISNAFLKHSGFGQAIQRVTKKQ